MDNRENKNTVALDPVRGLVRQAVDRKLARVGQDTRTAEARKISEIADALQNSNNSPVDDGRSVCFYSDTDLVEITISLWRESNIQFRACSKFLVRF